MPRCGTTVATAFGMAAVLCLVFLPLAMASVGFLASGATIPGFVFFALSAFIVLGAMNMARIWDAEEKNT